MARAVKRHFKIGATPHLDENELIVRMHESDRPEGTKWGNYISLSANKKRITCKLHSNAMAEIKQPRTNQISINKHLKSRLDIKAGTTVAFYMKRASSLKAPYYIMRYHPDRGRRRGAFRRILGVVVIMAAAIALTASYFLVLR